MTDQNFMYKHFHTAKYYADNELSKLKVYIYEDDINKKLKGKGLMDAEVLFRLMLNEVKQHNKKIETKKTLLGNLRQDRDWLSSKLFHGLKIPHSKIRDLIKEFPESDHYDLYKKLIEKY